MNASVYLQSFGWKEGEALQKGGLKKPILVKHKKDTKGLGHDSNDSDMWWEKLFDGQLKNLEVNNDSKNGNVTFETNNDEVVNTFQKSISPLYKMFVKGEGLAGTVGKTDHTKEKHREISSKAALKEMEKLTSGEKSLNGVVKKDKKEKKDKKDKKEMKDKKEKKDKKEEKEKSESKEKKDKKEKKAKSEKKDKKDKKLVSSTKDKKDKKDKSLVKEKSKSKRKLESDESKESKKKKRKTKA
ncbi:hypothetical protein G210_0304 [Candida maltosa Xu316]|uniref:G-patch domain-containing protein n=1 Tax=Candida maltosa (strain Xu316) TaxID=1245528 RepID=M3K2R4_CANMX|nr:hypothetical protein G210_0304 [Candida maltosa Xu316]